jgi:hypothetical protein
VANIQQQGENALQHGDASSFHALPCPLCQPQDFWRAFFTKRGYGGTEALVWSENWYYASSTNGRMVNVMFRVRNTTPNAINWTMRFWYTSYVGWAEQASLTLNGASTWNANNNCDGPPGCGIAAITNTIPASRISTIMVIASSGVPSTNVRTVYLHFVQNSMALPSGLEYVDDLETTQGDWTS